MTLAFAVPLVLAAAVESGVTLYSDASGRRRILAIAQLVLSASLVGLAVTRSAVLFTLGLSVAGASSGIACSAGQAMLVKAAPGEVDRSMVRWTLFATVGDLLAPLVTAGFVAAGFSYRPAMFVVALLAAAQATALASQRGVEPTEEEAPDPMRTALRRAFRSPRLWVWLVAAASCTLLDELVIALVALRLHREHGSSMSVAVVVGIAFSAGALAGTSLTDRVLRLGRRTLLSSSAALCLGAIALLVLAKSGLTAGAALFLVGLTCAPHHPLALSRAYETMPRNPGTVQAIGQLFVVVDVAAPLAFGVIADARGLGLAIACLAAQPLLILIVSALDVDHLAKP